MKNRADTDLYHQIERVVSARFHDDNRGWRIIIDGPSGSGKTTLASSIAQHIRTQSDTPVDIISLDDYYAGWDGLREASRITEDILQADSPSYPLWDWSANHYQGHRHLDPTHHWIIEGCGALTAQTQICSDCSLWVDAPPSRRFRRAMARDGDVFRPHWDKWTQQFNAHCQLNTPRDLADIELWNVPSSKNQ